MATKDYTRIIDDLTKRVKYLQDAISRAEGEKASYMKILKKDFGVSSVEEAEEELQALINRQEELEEQINSSIEEVKEILDGYEDEISKDS